MDGGRIWGATADEQAAAYPCDGLLPGAEEAWFRAVSVAAPAAVVFRWLCQLKVAPYSYDLLDNRGKRSPRTLTPGAEELEVGQPVMRIFDLESFEPGRDITIVLRRATGLFGGLAGTYRVEPVDERRSRIVVKLLVRHPGPGLVRRLRHALFPLGDLIMMRKQLLTLGRLAERDAAAA